MKTNKKSLILLIVAVIALVLFLGFAWTNNKSDDSYEKSESISEIEPSVTPYEKAKELRDEYLYFAYDDVMERLERLYPERENLLSEQQTKQLFPELWIGKSIACHAVESASFFRKEETVGIEGSLERGTDKLSVKINFDGTLDFITAAAVESGVVNGEPMEILVNNELTLIASDLESDKFLDTLTISKETGMSVWQSVNAAGFPMSYEVPDSQMIYLQCATPTHMN